MTLFRRILLLLSHWAVVEINDTVKEDTLLLSHRALAEVNDTV